MEISEEKEIELGWKIDTPFRTEINVSFYFRLVLVPAACPARA